MPFSSLLKKNSLQEGFSLIELLIVSMIMVMLAGGGIASFITFNAKQQLLTTAKELKLYLRSAQSLVRTGETPTGCTTLNGYQVSSQDSGGVKEITLSAVCESGTYERQNFFFPESVTLSSDFSIIFLGLHGGVTGATSLELVSDSGDTYGFAVTQGGEITQGGLNQ